MTGIHICVTCDLGTGLPDEHWLTLLPMRGGTPVNACSPRCLVVYLERTYRPTGIGVKF